MDKERAQLNYVYKWARSRCNNPNVAQYKDYGGRGIKFLFNSFEEFLEELGPRPTGYSLDRINNDGNYEKGNVRWASRKTQNSNKGIYDTNTSGVAKISVIKPTGKYISVRYRSRVSVDGKRIELYVGKDFFEACCSLKSWESKHEVT